MKPDKQQWVFLNGAVAVGPETHVNLFRNLADRVGLDARLKANIRSQWINNLKLAPGLEADIARGHMEPTGHANIWESNVDRNHVRDTVEKAHQGINASAWKLDQSNL